MRKALSSAQRELLETVIRSRRPDLLHVVPNAEATPLSVRNELRSELSDEFADYELIDQGQDVTPRGIALEDLIDALGPTLEDPPD